MFFRVSPFLKNILFVMIALPLMIIFAEAQDLEIPVISKVQVSPDQKQITIEGDKALGNHTAFAFQNPYRLVIDFETTGLGKIPLRIKVDKPPINEIRLGKNDKRARLVIDFGEYPVPPFMVEKRGKLAVVALGNVPTDPRAIQGNPGREPTQRPAVSQALRPKPHTPGKKDPANVPVPAPATAESAVKSQPVLEGKVESSSFEVKQSLVTNSLLLVELQNKKFPSETFRIVVDLNLKDLTVQNASISGSNGIVKKFRLVESDQNDSTHASNSRKDEESSSIGPRRSVVPKEEAKPVQKYSWGSDSHTRPRHQVRNVAPGSINSNPFRLQEFELKSKNSGTASLEKHDD
jgi:hypothetical protein